MDESRIVEIETKLAYQEYTLKELNDVVYEQQKQIDTLNKTVSALKEHIRQLTEAMQASPAADEKPPHY